MITVTILGSGGAAGVPAIAAGWGKCDPTNPKNRRLRPSILVETATTRVLVDTSPDLRQQLLTARVQEVHGILYTHAHADHLHGVDDIREINRHMRRPIPVWASQYVLGEINRRFGYVFEPMDDKINDIYKPWLHPNEITGAFSVGDLDVVPFEQDHGYMDSLGFRFGPVAYSTDVVRLPEASFDVLQGIDTWIIGCLTNMQDHPTHVTVDTAIQWVERVKPRRAIITHMGSRLDYQAIRHMLPDHMEPAYDGMVVSV